MSPPNTGHRPGLIVRILIWIAGVDEATLQQCPPHDCEAATSIALIMVCTMVYQTIVFSVSLYMLYPSEEFNPLPIVVAVFFAGFVLVLDKYTVVKSSWYINGVASLKQGGIDIAGGCHARVKNWCSLGIRYIFAFALAQLTATFGSLAVYYPDIMAQLQAASVKDNVSLLKTVTAPVDADIQLTTELIRTESKRYTELSAQVARIRQDQFDPDAGNVGLRQGQDELTESLTQKTKADEALAAAEAFQINEKGGIKGTADNSGQPGAGPRFRAAQAQVGNAQRRAKEAAAAVEAARARLASLRQEAGPISEAQRQKSGRRLPLFEQHLADQATKVAAAKARLAQLVQQRSKAIRQALEGAPDQVPPDRGLIAQLKVLRHLAEDPEILAVIIIIDLVALSFETACILATVTSFVPTNYAGILARDAYLHSLQLADELEAKLQQNRAAPTGTPSPVPPGMSPPAPPPVPPIVTPPSPGAGPAATSATAGPSPGGAQPKRSRGRPRKTAATPAAGAAAVTTPIAPAA